MHLQYIVRVVCDQKCSIFVLFIHQRFQSQNHFLEMCALCVCTTAIFTCYIFNYRGSYGGIFVMRDQIISFTEKRDLKKYSS